MEIPISHKNFPLKPHKGPKRIFLTEQVVVTETRYCYSNRRKKTFFLWQKQIFCHRKEIMSQKKCLSDKNSAREKIPSVYKFSSEKIFLSEFLPEKHISVIEEGKSFCDRKKNSVIEFFATEKKFLSEKKASVTEARQKELIISRQSDFFTQNKM